MVRSTLHSSKTNSWWAPLAKFSGPALCTTPGDISRSTQRVAVAVLCYIIKKNKERKKSVVFFGFFLAQMGVNLQTQACDWFTDNNLDVSPSK